MHWKLQKLKLLNDWTNWREWLEKLFASTLKIMHGSWIHFLNSTRCCSNIGLHPSSPLRFLSLSPFGLIEQSKLVPDFSHWDSKVQGSRTKHPSAETVSYHLSHPYSTTVPLSSRMARKRTNANHSESDLHGNQSHQNSNARTTATSFTSNSSSTNTPLNSGTSTPTSESSDSWVDKNGKTQHLPKKIVLERTNNQRPSLAGHGVFGRNGKSPNRSTSYRLKAPGTPFDEVSWERIWLDGVRKRC